MARNVRHAKLRVGHADHAPALGPEQRLDDHVPAERLERILGVVGPLTYHRHWHRQPGRDEPDVRQVLVHARFHGPRRVQHRHPGRGRRVQQVHAEHDLLQRPGRHRADDHAVVPGERAERWTRVRATRGQPAEVEHVRRVTQFGRGPQKVLDVPAGAAGNDGDPHQAWAGAGGGNRSATRTENPGRTGSPVSVSSSVSSPDDPSGVLTRTTRRFGCNTQTNGTPALR